MNKNARITFLASLAIIWSLPKAVAVNPPAANGSDPQTIRVAAAQAARA